MTLALLLLLAGTALGQTITPVIQECGKKCSGTFSVKNNQVVPMSVILQPISFSLTPQSVSQFRPLDSSVHVTLDRNSVRLSPLDSFTFSYKIVCQTYPCLVQISAIMSASRKADSGINIAFVLPEVIYQCESKKDCRKTVRKAAGIEQTSVNTSSPRNDR